MAVVGAGPAGLSAAVSAAERGFAVTLFEKSDSLGGQFRLAMQVPGKEDFRETLRYYTRRLEVLGVDVRLDTEATAADLAAYDEVIVATGVEPRIPELDGVDHPKVVSYAEVLSGAVVPGKFYEVGEGNRPVDREPDVADAANRYQHQDELDEIVGEGPAVEAGSLQVNLPLSAQRVRTLRADCPEGRVDLGRRQQAVQLDWIKNAQFAGSYMAAEKGYYTANGFESVDILAGGPDIAVMIWDAIEGRLLFERASLRTAA